MTHSVQTVIEMLRQAAPAELAERLENGPGFDVQLAGESLSWQIAKHRGANADRWTVKYDSSPGLEAAVDVRVDPAAHFAVYQVTLTNTSAAAVGPLTVVSSLHLSISRMETSNSYWGPPLYPFKAMIPIGAFMLAMQGLTKFIRDFVRATTGREI